MRKESNPLTPAEVAEILKISKYTVYEMVKRGEIPAYRVGKKIRVDSQDLQEYIDKGKGNEPAPDEHLVLPPASLLESPLLAVETTAKAPGLVICGQDICLDILGRHLEHHPAGVRAYRQNLGSFAGLLALYQDRADLAAIHLWDSDSNSYNIPYVRRLLPGIPAVVIHLACRMQGFYVARGNPKNIKQWEDLMQPGIRFVNREAGSGTRVLIDEQFRVSGINRQMVKGYENLEFSSLAVASAVSRGIVEVGVGNQKASMQVRDIDFIPLRKERYELVIKKEDIDRAPFQAVLEILKSPAFKAELQGLGDYDLSETGKTVAEV
uniref:Putative molybdopterin biosynthesis protein MJ0886 n=1 Tax=uncultured bacterium pBIO2079 TaxID=1478040 RepID=A0A075FAE0_9BACT|nr:putative molybdopterin biosynthesis protein MJ0886 [uncultured bacterium pBIO2079]